MSIIQTMNTSGPKTGQKIPQWKIHALIQLTLTSGSIWEAITGMTTSLIRPVLRKIIAFLSAGDRKLAKENLLAT